MASLSPQPRQRNKQARPQQLLDAALQLFVDKGFSATRSDDVAAHAGVSKGTLYLYFPSKEELFKAVVRSNISALIAEGQAIAERFDGSSAQLLRLLMHSWWQRVGDTRAGGLCKIVITEARHFPELARFYVDEVMLPAQRLVKHALARGIERGEFRDVALDEATYTLIAPLLFQALYRHSLGKCDLSHGLPSAARLIDTQLELLLHGLRSRAPRRRKLAGSGADGGAASTRRAAPARVRR